MNDLLRLIEKYKSNINHYHDRSYNESQLRTDFLDPLFECLGWDISNKKGKSYNEREVLVEEALKENASSNSKKPDYTFRLFSERKFFLEAKKPTVNIIEDDKAAKQTRRYGYTAKLKISVLSNFEHLVIYDCSEIVHESDSFDKCRIKIFHFSEYVKKFDTLRKLIGRDSVYSGAFDQEWKHIEDKLDVFGIDKIFLKQLNDWRLELGKEIYNFKPETSERDLNDLVQGYLNSIIFLRVCEDRNIEEYQTLLKFADDKDFNALIEKFISADKKYNSGLFSHQYTEEIIRNSHSTFWNIIINLYYPECPYSFAVFSSDIIGNIYEIFIAKKIMIEDGSVSIANKPDTLNRDIVTTPLNIIQDIIRQTISLYCEGKTDIEILTYRFADIACGSGAFLLEVFQVINDILIDYYLLTDKSEIIQVSNNSYKLKFDTKRKILSNCIFGVDKDFNAVEAARFGLLLKLLEGENNHTIRDYRPILPDLSNNIVYGNSLLSLDDVPSDYVYEINPFDIKENQFDVIIGNPPYMSTEDMKNFTPKEFPLYKKKYDSAYKQFDKYYLFVERSIRLLKSEGFLGYIIPSKFTKVGAAKRLRELLSQGKFVKQIVSFGANQIFDKKTTYTCLIILEKKEHDFTKYFEVKNYIDWKIREYNLNDFDNISSQNLADDSWVLIPKKLRILYKKILNQSISLDEILGDGNIYNGIQTSANAIYIHKIDRKDDHYTYFTFKGTQWKIENKITRPYFQTSRGLDNLYTYRPFQPNSFVIYPYENIDGKIELFSLANLEESYPEGYKYLKEYKHILSNPKRDIKPTPETPDEWYRYGRHQCLDKCAVPQKIIVGVLSQGDKYAIDFHQTLISSGGTAGYCMITLPKDCPYSIYYIQALLNSKYLEWFSSIYGEVFRGGFIARGTKVLKRLPIRQIDFDRESEVILYNSITETQEKLIETQGIIDNCKNKRELEILERHFKSLLATQNSNLKNLYDFGDEDSDIPIIKEIYGTN